MRDFIDFCLKKLEGGPAECIEDEDRIMCYCYAPRTTVKLARIQGSDKLEVTVSDVDEENKFVIDNVLTALGDGVTLSNLQGELRLDNVNPIAVMEMKDRKERVLYLLPKESFEKFKLAFQPHK